jgi:hypothetical protein
MILNDVSKRNLKEPYYIILHYINNNYYKIIYLHSVQHSSSLNYVSDIFPVLCNF